MHLKWILKLQVLKTTKNGKAPVHMRSAFQQKYWKKYFLNKKKSTENTIQYLFPNRRGNSYGKQLDRKKAKGQTQRTRQSRESVFEIQ